MNWGWKLLAGVVVVACCAGAARAGQTFDVRDRKELLTAVGKVGPGDTIRILPGKYAKGIEVRQVHGTEKDPITIEGADPENPPQFEGGNEAWHLSGCSYVTLRNLVVRDQRGNGINVDDAGVLDKPAHHIRLERIRVEDIGPKGNHDGIKMSGLDDFVVEDCRVEGWAGQTIDMVGCHRGLIQRCTFQGKPGFAQHTGIQVKGGSQDIRIQRCVFRQSGARAVNLGGSTGLAYFRPQGVKYEAKDIRVEGCLFVGSEAPLAFVGIDGAVVRYNTIYHPETWVLRILQETRDPGFVPCRDGEFSHNLVVFRKANLRDAVNVGPHTAPSSFRFTANYWYCEDQPSASQPSLPVRENGSVYGVDPKLASPIQEPPTPGNPQARGYGWTGWREEKRMTNVE